MFSLLMLLLPLRAVTGQGTFIAIREGNKATLSCENLIQDQVKCDGTTWFFSSLGGAKSMEVVTLGLMGEDVQDTSGRLSITENCSLVIKNVTVKDVGTYVCHQYKSGERQADPAGVDLSVVTMTEHHDSDEATLNCSVTSYEAGRHKVEWLQLYHDVDTNDKDAETSRSGSSASVKLASQHLEHKHLEVFMCKVTDIYTKQVQLFTFSSQSACAQPVLSLFDYVMLVLRVAELVLITAITVLLVRVRGNQRPPDGSAAQNDADDFMVNYENLDGSSVSVLTGQQLPHRLRNNRKMIK